MGKYYKISDSDLPAAVNYIARKTADISDINVLTSWIKVSKDNAEQVSLWCDKHFDDNQLTKLKGAIRASRLNRKKAELRNAAISTIKVSAEAHELITEKCHREKITVADFIDDLLDIER